MHLLVLTIPQSYKNWFNNILQVLISNNILRIYLISLYVVVRYNKKEHDSITPIAEFI